MALISEWMEQCGKKVLDNAGIVREAMLQQLTVIESGTPIDLTIQNKSEHSLRIGQSGQCVNGIFLNNPTIGICGARGRHGPLLMSRTEYDSRDNYSLDVSLYHVCLGHCCAANSSRLHCLRRSYSHAALYSRALSPSG
jgi:hypothetical protein